MAGGAMARADAREGWAMEALGIDGAWVYTPRIFADNRGSLAEAYRIGEFAADLGYPLDLLQVNWSVSKRGVIRGIHFTEVPPGQAKYVFCPSGALLDVIVDLRVGSPTYLNWETVRLDETERKAVYLEHGLGHAFMALSPSASAVYLCTKAYEPTTDHDVNAMDPDIDIRWPADVEVIMSAKDKEAPSLAQIAAAGVLPTFHECMRFADELRSQAAAGVGNGSVRQEPGPS